MNMKVHLPAVTLPLEKGLEYYYANSKFLPIFYRIPKEILKIRDRELMWIPRTPASAYYDAEVIRFVESDIFMNGLINCVAYMARELTDFRELTPTIVNSLIQKIQVHNNDKYDGHCHVKVGIYFTAVGMIDIPDEKE